ncbi:MAG: translocation/assembly module TamB domain-containing protein [Pyrinomonadaceae bacterium]
MPDKNEQEKPEPSGESRREEAPAVRRSRGFFTRRRVLLGIGASAVIILLIFAGFLIYVRSGAFSNYVKTQFVTAFDEMGISMKAKQFDVTFSPFGMTVKDAEFFNKKNGKKIVEFDSAELRMSIMDLWAASRIRNVSIDRADIDGLEVWIEFDQNGKSNYEGIELLPPKSSVRFQYAAANVHLSNGLLHFGDQKRVIAGNAKELALLLTPDEKRPADSKDIAYNFDLSATKSDFVYDTSKVEPIGIKARGRLHEEGADISSLSITSPVGDSSFSGTIKDWSRLIYDLKVTSTVDLTRVSTTFPLTTPINGIGNFNGKVSGEGENYKISGEVSSESLAASNIRLKGLRVNADANGSGAMYEANGKAVAELLTFGDFRIDFPSLVGSIRGTGADFKWWGELQAAAADSPLGTIGSLYISDAVAEYEDNQLLATFGNFRAREFSSDSVRLQSIQTSNIRIVSRDGLTVADVPRATASTLNVDNARMNGVAVDGATVRNRNGETEVDAERAKVEDFESGDTKLRGAVASNIKVRNRNGQTSVTAGNIRSDQVKTGSATTDGVDASNVEIDYDGRSTGITSTAVKIARVDTDAAVLSNLNVAGVRLTVRDGTIEGTTSDFDAGDIDLKGNGRLNAVAVKKPVFVLEPSGRYRATMDMTLGGGLLGNVALGNARASVVADNERINLDDLTAEVMEGDIKGSAVIASNSSTRSSVNADFTGLDLSKLLAVQGGRMIPLEGKTDGRAELSFPGTDFKRASGTLRAEINANAGTEEKGFIPVTGRLEANAVNGLFNVDYASFETEKSILNANGKFDLGGYGSDLAFALNSSDAAEIDRIIRVIGIAPDFENQLDKYEVNLAGNLVFNGKLTGNLSEPNLDGRASLDTLLVRGKDVGSVSATVATTSTGAKIDNGELLARNGGSMNFAVAIPYGGQNNASVEATLKDFELATLGILIPPASLPEQLRDFSGRSTGNLNLFGLPGDLRGDANLQAQNGEINGQSFEGLNAKATFEKDLIRIETFEAGFGNGTLKANGDIRTEIGGFNLNVEAANIPATKILAFFPKSESIPDIAGAISLTGTAVGANSDSKTWNFTFEGTGTGVAINGSRLGRMDFKGVTENNVLTADLTGNVGGRKQLITASVNFADQRLPLTARSILDRTPVAPYIAIFRPQESGSVEITGNASGEINISGFLTRQNEQGERVFSTDGLRGTAVLSDVGLLFDEIPLNSVDPVRVSFSMSEIDFESARFAGSGSNVTVTGTKAFTDSGMNALVVEGKVNLGIIRAFSRNTLRNVFLTGVADVEMRLSGVNRTAVLNGTAVLENGSAATFVGSNRVTFERVNGIVRFTTNQIQFERITANLGGGQVTATGGALLTDRLNLDRIRLEIRGTNITAPLPEDFITTGNADIEINGRLEGNEFATLVSGTIIARRSVYRKDIDLADLISNRRDATLNKSSDSDAGDGIYYSPPTLDIRILGREALVVKNNLADLTASADLRLEGDVEAPRLSGRITASRGTIFFRNDRYEVQRGVLTFPPNTDIEPRINLQAETEVRGYQIFVNLSGDLSDTDALTTVVTSNPALPQQDIVSLITTGNLSNTADGIPTIAQGGLNTAAEILTDEIINRPISKATDKLFGLNRFELDPIVSGQRGNPTARLTVGRQINKNLLATYSTNLSQDQNQVLALEYRVSNRLSFVATYEQRSLTNVTQNRNKFSFEIRLRKRF